MIEGNEIVTGTVETQRGVAMMTKSLAMTTKRRRGALWDPAGTRRPMTRRRTIKIITIVTIGEIVIAIETTGTETGGAVTGTGIEIVDIPGTTDPRIDTETIGLATTRRRIARDRDRGPGIARLRPSER